MTGFPVMDSIIMEIHGERLWEKSDLMEVTLHKVLVKLGPKRPFSWPRLPWMEMIPEGTGLNREVDESENNQKTNARATKIMHSMGKSVKIPST